MGGCRKTGLSMGLPTMCCAMLCAAAAATALGLGAAMPGAVCRGWWW
jgi:hypothetical protein